jgi:hypothetical protein
MERIDRSSEPTLHFIHSYLPHPPAHYLPSGAHFNQPRLNQLRAWTKNWWPNDEIGVLQAEKHYLMQSGFVDTLLGRLLERLVEMGLFDEALIVVTSDHGWSFRPGQSSRMAYDETAADILPVPLFIKAPRQSEGRIDDRPVETVDILPTLADLLALELPWQVHGRSLLDPAPLGRAKRSLYRTEGVTDRAADEQLWRTALAEKLRRFGARTPMEDVLAAGLLPELVGKRLSELEVRGTAPYRVSIADPELYGAVDPDSGFVPVFLHGTIESDAGAPEYPVLVIAVNGVIAAVTNVYDRPRQRGLFQALVSESALRRGANRIEVLAAARIGGRLQLRFPRAGGSIGPSASLD